MDDDLVRRLREHADRLSSRFGTVELIRSAADALDKFQDFKAIALVELASRVGDDFVARVAGLFGDLPCQTCGTTQPLIEAAPTRCIKCNKNRGM